MGQLLLGGEWRQRHLGEALTPPHTLQSIFDRIASIHAEAAAFLAVDTGRDYSTTDIKDVIGNAHIDFVERLIIEAQQVIRELLPERFFRIAFDSHDGVLKDELSNFLNRVRLIQTLLAADGEEEFIRRHFNQYAEMSFGDATEIYGESPFNSHGNSKPRKIAALRLMALAAYEAGREAKIPAHSLQSDLATAYKTSFDSIRKWERYCRRVLGNDLYDHQYARELKNWRLLISEQLFEFSLFDAGKVYFRTWRSARKAE